MCVYSLLSLFFPNYTFLVVSNNIKEQKKTKINYRILRKIYNLKKSSIAKIKNNNSIA